MPRSSVASQNHVCVPADRGTAAPSPGGENRGAGRYRKTAMTAFMRDRVDRRDLVRPAGRKRGDAATGVSSWPRDAGQGSRWARCAGAQPRPPHPGARQVAWAAESCRLTTGGRRAGVVLPGRAPRRALGRFPRCSVGVPDAKDGRRPVLTLAARARDSLCRSRRRCALVAAPGSVCGARARRAPARHGAARRRRLRDAAASAAPRPQATLAARRC